MKQYLLSVWHDGAEYPTPPAEVMEQMFRDVDAFNKELEASGAYVFAAGLHPASTATVVQSSGGQVTTTDGPYAESKEQMGGFWIVKAPDLDAALAIAARGAAACQGPVEVRPLQDESED
ncbi:YciI family protein [Kineococcus glutinatus]|uniref:YciI family protein n=1 Tax=Kineococcus glutinatus TaxID=1070872 RepID=A0ABP9I1K9_9ACTN